MNAKDKKAVVFWGTIYKSAMKKQLVIMSEHPNAKPNKIK